MDTAARLGPQCVTVRMLTLADVLELPVVRRGLPEVVAGAEAVGRELRWAHVLEMPDPAGLLKGGELVLTTGMGAGDRAASQRAWIGSLIEQGAAAGAGGLGRCWRGRVPGGVGGGRAGGGGAPVCGRRGGRLLEDTEAGAREG